MAPFITGSYTDPHNVLPLLRSHPIQRAADTSRSSIKHVRVDQRRLDITMSQQLLDHSNVGAAFKQMRDKGILQRVAGAIIVSVAPNVHGEQEPVVTFSADSCPRSRLRAETVAVLVRGLIDSTETGTGRFSRWVKTYAASIVRRPECTRMSCTV